MSKIAFVTQNFKLGGIQKSLINVLNSIDYRNTQVDVYIFDKNIFYINEINKKANIILVPNYPFSFKFIRFDIIHNIITKYNSTKKYDYVVDFDSYQFNTSHVALSLNADHYISWIHNDKKNETKYNFKFRILDHFMKSKYKYFDTFVSVSNGALKSFKAKYKLKNKKYAVIPNIIDTDEILSKAKEKIDDVEIDPTKYNLVSTGRLVIQKGFDYLIKDMKEVVKEREDIHLYILGSGPEKEHILNLIDKYKLNSFITLLPSKQNPFKYMNACDGFILESRYEGQGMSILEAKVLGLDIYIPERIEEYNGYNIKGTKDIVSALIKAKKNEDKEIDTMDKYNEDIENKLEDLFKVEN